MQTWTAHISEIQPIPNKDRVVLATVNGYQAIVPANHYEVGEVVVYIAEQSILSDALQEELGLVGKLAGAAKNRVKTIKMGGVMSQGIVCKPDRWLAEGRPQGDLDDWFAGAVTKYEPVIPIHMTGKIARPRGNAPIAPMYDIENIKKQRHMRFDYDPMTGEPVGDGWWYDPFRGKYVQVTEKLHGTNFACHMNAEDHQVYIYSKGLGKQGHVILEDEQNVYWRALRKYPQIERFMAETLRDDWEYMESITVRGEVIGNGIQDLTYGVDFDLALFAVETRGVGPSGERWETSRHPSDYYRDNELGKVPHVPILFQGWYDYDQAVELSMGKNLYGTPELHVREGVVVAVCGDDAPYRQMNGLRYAAKFINPDYLLRKGGTEFN